MSEVAESLGLRLKVERERKGFSAQKAADDLHLDAWVIEALESGDYARIGPRVYAKGHLKHYATLLGLSPDEALAAFDGGAASPVIGAEAPAQASTLRLRTAEASVQEIPWWGVAGGAGVALIVAVLALWHPWRSHETPVATTASAVPAAAAPTASPTGLAGDDAPELSATGAKVAALSVPAVTPAGGGAGADSGALVPGAGRARLRLRFSADSWVDVHDATGRRVFAGQGRANSVKVVAGVAPMKIYLGYASGVQLEVNNRVVAISPQFVAGDVARFAAGADGVLRREPAPAAGAAAGATATTAANPRPRG